MYVAISALHAILRSWNNCSIKNNQEILLDLLYFAVAVVAVANVW